MEIILNRWRGTGDIFYISKFAITGTMIYALYIGLLFGLLSTWYIGLLSIALFLLGESFGLGKWVGYLTYSENYNKEQFENNKAGSKFPFIHQTANYFINQSNPYKYSVLALSIRGLYWWLPLYLLFAYIGLINYIESIIIGVLLGVGFPSACILSRRFSFTFKHKYLVCTDNWHRQELIYGMFQGTAVWYVIFKNLI